MTTAERTEIESLLAQLDETRNRILLARTYGVRPAALRDLKQELRSTQEKLAGSL
jgi:hypothetical protein